LRPDRRNRRGTGALGAGYPPRGQEADDHPQRRGPRSRDHPLPGGARGRHLRDHAGPHGAGGDLHRTRRKGWRAVKKIWILARMTFREAIRRRIVLTGLVLGVLFLIVYSAGFRMIYHEVTYEASLGETTAL